VRNVRDVRLREALIGTFELQASHAKLHGMDVLRDFRWEEEEALWRV
jgi:hypothetical protein